MPFELASDEDHSLAQAYGVWVEKSMYGRKYWGNERSTFLINPAGEIAWAFAKVKPATHSEQVLKKLRELQSQ